MHLNLIPLDVEPKIFNPSFGRKPNPHTRGNPIIFNKYIYTSSLSHNWTNNNIKSTQRSPSPPRLPFSLYPYPSGWRGVVSPTRNRRLRAGTQDLNSIFNSKSPILHFTHPFSLPFWCYIYLPLMILSNIQLFFQNSPSIGRDSNREFLGSKYVWYITKGPVLPSPVVASQFLLLKR